MKQTKRCILTEEQFDRLQILLEQIEGMAELLQNHLSEATDNAALTAYNVIREKAREAFKIAGEGFGHK